VKGRLAAAALLLWTAGCAGDLGQRQGQRTAVFVGIDVSGSFLHSRYFDDSLEFLSHYLYGHLNGAEGMFPPKELFVGAIGGQSIQETKSFHPIHDFEGKTPEQIKADLKEWYKKGDYISDFDAFFGEVANIARKRNLSLMPITIIMLTDGIPAVPGKDDKPDIGRFGKIDLSPIEYLSRNVTVRVLYADPTVANKWETAVPRKRVRMWTVDSQVMTGWRAQLQPGVDELQQARLWKWVKDIVDYRVMAGRFQSVAARKPKR
jgi:hypothetical protein